METFFFLFTTLGLGLIGSLPGVLWSRLSSLKKVIQTPDWEVIVLTTAGVFFMRIAFPSGFLVPLTLISRP